MKWQLVAEFLAVFLGVSLSLLVSNWRDRRAERRTAERALHGIGEDVAAELETLNLLQEVYGPTAQAAEDLHRRWDALSTNPERAEEVLTALHLGNVFTPARAHYQAVKSAGTLGLIQNSELKTAIASVFEQQQRYLRTQSEITAEHDFEFMRSVQPYIRYSEGKATAIQTYVIPGQAELNFSVVLPDSSAEKLSEDVVAQNKLYRLVLFRKYFVSLLDGYREALEKLRALLAGSTSEP